MTPIEMPPGTSEGREMLFAALGSRVLDNIVHLEDAAVLRGARVPGRTTEWERFPPVWFRTTG